MAIVSGSSIRGYQKLVNKETISLPGLNFEVSASLKTSPIDIGYWYALLIYTDSFSEMVAGHGILYGEGIYFPLPPPSGVVPTLITVWANWKVSGRDWTISV